MYAYDFEYDGKLLSDFGMVVCSFANGGVSNGSKGSEISFNLVPAGYGKRYFVAGLQYENCLSTAFQICKDPERVGNGDPRISNEEFRALSRWLNRKKFLWFRSFDRCEPEQEKPWFRASFILTRIEYGRDTVGIELNMMTDAPFGYGDEIEETLTFAAGSLSKTVLDRSDEIGDLYPFAQITPAQAGTITVSNAMTGCATQIKNCAASEVITMSGESMIVSSSATGHELANDFNYDFFRIGNTAQSRENVITASAPCTLYMKYRPILKDTL